jgi:hypothetical protein
VCPEVGAFKLVNGIVRDGEREKVVQATAGISFSIVLTESGKGMSVLALVLSFYYRANCGCSVLVWECGKGAVGERHDRGTYNDWEQDGV